MSWLEQVIGYGTHAARPAAGSAGRLYYETDTDTLLRDNGTTWDVLALGGSAPGYALIGLQTVGSSGATYLEFTDIPSGYKRLYCDLRGKTDSTDAYCQTYLMINGDATGAHYSEMHYYNDMAGGAGGDHAAGTSLGVGIGALTMSAALDPNTWGSMHLTLPDYDSTTAHKAGTFAGESSTTYSTYQYTDGHLIYASTAAIESLRFTPVSGKFLENTTVALYGIPY